ncbi:hypothetical protein [Bosea sp. PAMC 26642]|uniref:hypothetical protein n=1 Tax=Bosea sp. (strain PAMC 26642) TaxID=1792307 RepID=UPI0012E6FDE5|nr:hypothetical protein [Bosea sp. PAMC 26642]
MNTQAKRQTIATADGWYDLAKVVEERLARIGHGDREGVYQAFAREHGVSRHVPQRLARASRFLATLAEETPFEFLASRLRSQPLASVSVIARWYNYAPDHATRAAEDLVDGKISLTGLIAQERADRSTGERVAGATDRAWQTYASVKASEFVEGLYPAAKFVWAARGWGPDGPRFNNKIPGLLGRMKFLPSLHLAFTVSDPDRHLLVCVLSAQGEKRRVPTAIAQLVLTLTGYARRGYDVLLLVGLSEDLEVARIVLDQLGRPDDVQAHLLDLS